jgi:ATP-binding cassette subfamily B protein
MLIKLFGRRAEEDEQFADKAAVVRDLGIRIALVSRVFGATLMLIPALATALVYGVGGHLAIDGTLTVGTLLALATLLLRLLGPLQGLSNVRIDVMTALVSFERVFEVLDLPSMIAERPGAVMLPRSAARVEFDHVAFRYPRADEVSLASLESVARLESRDTGEVLRDVSFTAEPGQMVALVGPSGAGKTTITHLVARLYDVTSGTVRVGGHDVRDVTLQSLEDAVGYVTQDAHMFHDTIRENMRYARPEADDEQIWAALDAAQIRRLVESLPDGLDTVVGDRGYRLSGGERQRLAIARLLLKAPSIVVLDEATAHLDSESEVAVQRALDEALHGRTSLVIAHRLSGGERQRLAIARLLLKAPRIVVLDEATAHLDSESEYAVQRALDTALEGRTSLVIAHRLSTVRNADQILVVDDGRIVQRGTHDELLAEGGTYADLYATQFSKPVGVDSA